MNRGHNGRPHAHINTRLLVIVAGLAGAGVCAFLGLVLSGLLLLVQPPPDSLPPATVPSVPRNSSTVRVAVPTATPAPELPQAVAITAEPQPEAQAPGPSTAPETGGSAVAMPAATPQDCPPPAGWVIHYVEPGETLFAYVLGAINTGTTITTHDVRGANCLTSDLLQIGQALYLPPDAAENAPPSEPVSLPPGDAPSGPRTPQCDPHCTISIRPGSRAEQIAAAIDNLPVAFWGSDFLAAIGPGASPPAYAFLAGKPSGASLEGFLFPGTYQLTNATTAADFRDMLLAAFAAVYSGDMEAAASAHGMTFYQALTLASIIQRESWATAEQVLISSVFHNRLQAGMPLGASVTTQYVLGGPSNWWPRLSAGQINTPSSYNTNTNPGLPPTPIDSPGSEALRAALQPADTAYLYFTGNCQGPGNLYAVTYDEHLANVNLCR